MTLGLYSPCNSPGQNTGVGSHSLLQGILLTQKSNQGLLHCRWILYQLSYQEASLSYLFLGLQLLWKRLNWLIFILVVAIQSLSHVPLLATPWTIARQAPLSLTMSQTLLKFMSIEPVMLSNHLVLCCSLLLLFPSIRVFSSELAFCIRCQSIEVSTSALILSMNIQG